jgi:hypothetical protein
MADTDKALIAQLTKLIALQKDYLEKLNALSEEIDTLLGGGAGTAANLKILEKAFDEQWCLRYAPGRRGCYVWQFSRDVPHLKRLLRKLPIPEITARMMRYIGNDDPFYVKARHPFGLFVSSINSHAGEALAPESFDLEPPADCKHSPVCKSDQEHTRKVLQEARG